MASNVRKARVLLAAAGLLLATGARGAGVAVSWDAELAPPEGRAACEARLRAIAAVAFLEQRAGRDRRLAVVRATLAGEPFERALARELSLAPDEVDRGFEAWAGRP
jgi:hypothetical protein